ncbi:MAG TPA: PTS sugar transporter subunit IIA, partial [Rectinema sp.]|nr:PTS sugar transporter subunit IIA [Rectinema sp.]
MIIGERMNDPNVMYLVDPEDKAKALNKLIGSAPLPNSLDREALFDALLSREDMMSTAIGNGIAIPHVRLFDSMS